MKKIALLILAAVVFAACGPNREKTIENIKAFEDNAFESSIAADTAVADQLTNLYLDFAKRFPKDSLAPVYLLKAGEAQSNVLHTQRSIEIFDRVISDYPDFEDIALAYFLKGTAYDNNSQYDDAKAAYQEFVDRYPDHYLAEGARQIIPRIGMSPEEMLADILEHANDTIIAQN